MRYLILLFLIISTFSNYALAEEDISTDAYPDFDSIWQQQKPITNEQFEKTIKAIEGQKKKKKGKGQLDESKNQKGAPPPIDSIKNEATEYINILVPCELLDKDKKIIPVGFYNIKSETKNNETFLTFYQGFTKVGAVKASPSPCETFLNEKTIVYTRLVPVNDYCMKLLWGNINDNLEAFILIKP